MLFLIVNIDKPGRNDLRLANRPAQHDYIEQFRDRIVFAGPTVTEDGSMSTGNMFVFEAGSYDEVLAFTRGDPYFEAGLFDTTLIRPWRWTFNMPADSPGAAAERRNEEARA